ncbi:MAG: RidA family protein [Actinobacteria bacterium]|nr:RidA family protein [Actinomycetota bacterium]
MKHEALQPEGIAKPQAPYSPVVVSGDLVATAGQVAFDEDGAIVGDGIEDQARQVFDNLSRCLAAAGCGLEHVIKVTTFLSDFGDFAAYNAVYESYFSSPYPARTTVQTGLAPGLRIEVEALARKPS